jgi:hypothetical protein
MGVIRKFSNHIFLFFLIVGVIIGFLWFKTRIRGNVDSKSVLPESTALIIECASFPTLAADLQNNNKMWKDISSSGLFGEVTGSLNQIDSLIKTDAQVRGFLDKRLCISVSLKANKTPGVLFCLPVSVRMQDKAILKILARKLSGFSYIKRRYEGNTIYDLTWNKVFQLYNPERCSGGFFYLRTG